MYVALRFDNNERHQKKKKKIRAIKLSVNSSTEFKNDSNGLISSRLMMRQHSAGRRALRAFAFVSSSE